MNHPSNWQIHVFMHEGMFFIFNKAFFPPKKLKGIFRTFRTVLGLIFWLFCGPLDLDMSSRNIGCKVWCKYKTPTNQ
jgi:hypothetical protein